MFICVCLTFCLLSLCLSESLSVFICVCMSLSVSLCVSLSVCICLCVCLSCCLGSWVWQQLNAPTRGSADAPSSQGPLWVTTTCRRSRFLPLPYKSHIFRVLLIKGIRRIKWSLFTHCFPESLICITNNTLISDVFHLAKHLMVFLGSGLCLRGFILAVGHLNMHVLWCPGWSWRSVFPPTYSQGKYCVLLV